MGRAGFSRWSSERRIGSSSSRSQVGSWSSVSRSRRRRERVVKNRKSAEAIPMSGVLGVAEHPAAGFGGGGGDGLGEGHLADRDGVAALGLDAGGVGDGFLDRGDRGGGHGVVEQDGDVLAFDGAGGDRGVNDGLVHSLRGRAYFVLVVGLAGGAGLGVGGDVGGAGRRRPLHCRCRRAFRGSCSAGAGRRTCRR